MHFQFKKMKTDTLEIDKYNAAPVQARAFVMTFFTRNQLSDHRNVGLQIKVSTELCVAETSYTKIMK